MSKLGEHRRVPLTTISTQRSSSNNNEAGFSAMPSIFSRFGSDFMEADAVQPNKSSKAATKSVRLELELFETDMSTYPEFNYSKLLYLEKVSSLWMIPFSVSISKQFPRLLQKKAKMLKTKTTNGSSDPFADNDDDVARIAKELEAKYGNSYARGRGRRKKDEVDIGMGYDENDSFIDNTEAVSSFLDTCRPVLQLGSIPFSTMNCCPKRRRHWRVDFILTVVR